MPSTPRNTRPAPNPGLKPGAVNSEGNEPQSPASRAGLPRGRRCDVGAKREPGPSEGWASSAAPRRTRAEPNEFTAPAFKPGFAPSRLDRAASSARPARLGRALGPLCALAAFAALAAPACGGDDDDNNARPGAGGSGTGGASGTSGAPSKGPVTEGCPPESALTYENFGAPFLLSWCNGCHSSSLPEGSRQSAPLGIDFDNLDRVRAHADRIVARSTGASASMPPAGGPPEAERQRLAEWVACGTPTEGQFTGLPQGTSGSAGASGSGGSGGSGGAPPVACAALGKALPAAALPSCKAETKGCLEACAGQADKDACERLCFAAEPAPAPGAVSCENCLLLQSIAYAETNGCGPLASEGFCCITTQCPGFDQACMKQKCAVETESMFFCIAYVTPEAFSSNPLRDACFAAAL